MTGKGARLGRLTPLVIEDCPGLLHEADGDIGVVICDGWGYEGLCARRSWRILADQLAGAGYPVLRFDWPGMGDALAEPRDVTTLAHLNRALDRACAVMAGRDGIRAVALIGLGLGAALAARRAAAHPEKVAGLALLAPLVKGKSFLREVQAQALMIGQVTGVPPETGPGEALSIAGLGMARELADEIRALDLSGLDVREDMPRLILAREGKAAEAKLADRLAGSPSGTAAIFAGYDDLMIDPTGSIPPFLDFERILAWFAASLPLSLQGAAAGDTAAATKVRLETEIFHETPCVFGPNAGLVGVWCEPCEVQHGRPVLFLNAGATPRAGWARGTAEMARALAGRGIASLRFDGADFGDSRPHPQGPAIMHYHANQRADLSAALDLLGDRCGSGAVVVGGCGGAYLALNGAVADERIAHVIAVNLQRFLWDPRDDVAEVLRYGHAAPSGYGRKLLSRDGWRALLRRRAEVPALALYLTRTLYRKAERRFAPYLFGLLPFSRLYRRVHRNLSALCDRPVRVELVYSEGDSGLEQLRTFFGRDSRRLGAYPNIELVLIADADHNLTPRAARAVLLERIAAAALATAGGDRRPAGAKDRDAADQPAA